jgi:hypothetical protein
MGIMSLSLLAFINVPFPVQWERRERERVSREWAERAREREWAERETNLTPISASKATLGKSSALSLTADSYISSVKTMYWANVKWAFLPNYRTTDHVFTPHTLIDKQTKIISKKPSTQFGMRVCCTNWWKVVLGENIQHYKIDVHNQQVWLK